MKSKQDQDQIGTMDPSREDEGDSEKHWNDGDDDIIRAPEASLSTPSTSTHLLPSTPTQMQIFQNFIRDVGILRSIVDFITRTVLAPAFYFENPHLFPQFIRISEYPHWIAVISNRLLNILFEVSNGKKDEDEKMNAARKGQMIGDDGMNYSQADDNGKVKNPIPPSLEPSDRISFHKESYGMHPSQRADVMIKEELGESSPSSLFLFLHGGAWGSGFPTMYRLISLPFLERNFRAVVLGYRTYPEGGMEEQIQDLVGAVEHFTDKYAGRGDGSGDNKDNDDNQSKVFLMGHSSGSHIAMMAALKGKLAGRVDGIIGMSGVYDLEEARERELQEGVSDLSPMIPACGGKLKEFSPSWLAMKRLSSKSRMDATEVPPILLLHGDEDTVAPSTYSNHFYNIMRKDADEQAIGKTPTCRLENLEGLQHQDTVLETCIGNGKTQSIIFDWIENVCTVDEKIMSTT